MRRLLGIVVCLWIVERLLAVEYRPIGFSSTSAYAGSQRSEQMAMMPPSRVQTYGSMSAISAANFTALNSEGGACYTPTDMERPKGNVRKGRSGGNGTGMYDFHSPVGATPCLFLALLAALYVVYKRPRSRASSSK